MRVGAGWLVGWLKLFLIGKHLDETPAIARRGLCPFRLAMPCDGLC